MSFQGRSSLPDTHETETDLLRAATRHIVRNAASLAGPPPCTDCPYRRMCASKQLACHAFVRYAEKGFAIRRKGVIPARWWWVKLFGE